MDFQLWVVLVGLDGLDHEFRYPATLRNDTSGMMAKRYYGQSGVQWFDGQTVETVVASLNFLIASEEQEAAREDRKVDIRAKLFVHLRDFLIRWPGTATVNLT